MRTLFLFLVVACATTAVAAPPTAKQPAQKKLVPTPPESKPCLVEPPPGEEEIHFMRDGLSPREDDNCPQIYFACVKVDDAQALARNLRKMREWVRYAWGHCGPR